MRDQLVALMACLAALPSVTKRKARSLLQDERGAINMGHPMAIVSIVVGGIVVVLLLASLTSPFFGAITDINENLTDASTGDEAGDTILDVFPLVIAVSGAIGFVGLVLAAVAFARSRR